MPGVAVEVVGGTKLRRALKEAGPDAEDALKKLNLDASQDVAAEAGRRVPVVSGRMKASIKAFGTKSGARVAVGKKALPYVFPIVFGWKARNIEPNPFIYEALDARRDDILAAYDKQIVDVLRDNGLA